MDNLRTTEFRYYCCFGEEEGRLFFLLWQIKDSGNWERRGQGAEKIWCFDHHRPEIFWAMLEKYWELTCPLLQQLCWHLFLRVKMRKNPKPKKEANNRVEFTSSVPFLDNCLFIPSLSLLSTLIPCWVLNTKADKHPASKFTLWAIYQQFQCNCCCFAKPLLLMCGQSFLQHEAGE